MVNQFKQTEERQIFFYDKTSKEVRERYVCPDCINHEQIHEIAGADCRNIFIDKNGNTIGQCGCYSKYHLSHPF